MYLHAVALLTGLVFSLAACSDQARTPVSASALTDEVPPPEGPPPPEEAPVPNQYIVVFADGTSASAKASALGVSPAHVYQTVLDGFAATLSGSQLNALESDPDLDFIEPNRTVAANATQTGAPWGLDRIDQRDPSLDGAYTYTATGAGVRVYVIDSGIRFSHAEFSGRASAGYDAVGDGRNGNDCSGHGTHVAGTVAGTTYGVAKQASLVSVRVLDCSDAGTVAGLLAGMEWVARNRVKPAVAVVSLSLRGSSRSAAIAVNRLHARAVPVVAAAGNGNADACRYSPAKAARAITVGATTSTDARAAYSNFGACVDLFAPGSSVPSAWHTSNTAVRTLSGTSMASAHAAGVAALYLDENPAASADSVAAALLQSSTPHAVSNAGTDSPNRLLNSLLVPLPVYVDVTCYRAVDACDAFAGGGSGQFRFDWVNANESNEGDTWSTAWVTCLPLTTYVTVTVTATDELTGVYATTSTRKYCD